MFGSGVIITGETEKRRQCDVRAGSITTSRSVVAARESLSGVFRGSLEAYSPRACSQVSGRSDILVVVMRHLDLNFIMFARLVTSRYLQTPLIIYR